MRAAVFPIVCIRLFSWICILLAITPAAVAVELFSPGQVRLNEGPFARRLEANRAYLLAHDPGRLLAPFRREAGLPLEAEPYGNWENTGLDGHTAGHYISALAYMASLTGSGELHLRLSDMVATLVECQAANGNGYLGGVPGSRELWKDVAAGRIRAGAFDLNGKWVPWYNLHKTFMGLRDAWLVAGHEPARDALIALTDWCDQLVANLSDEQLQDMLRSEHGGMNEVIADVAAITGDDRYLRLARRFTHRAILDPLARGEDRLNGLHANTQIPKVIGIQRIGALANDGDYQAAARFFWNNVVHRRSIAFGGHGVAEHFHAPEDFRGMLEHREGPESCNTYNMLRLTELLFQGDPRAEYADYYERALFNHILSAIHPADPGYVYFTSIRPGHYRVYSVPETHFWCCVGTGMENPGRYGDFIYARDREGLWINLFTASELNWEERGLTLRQETAFPDEDKVQLVLALERPQQFKLRLRHPGWLKENALLVTINGKPHPVSSRPSSYVSIEREWRDGDHIELGLPMHTWMEQLPDGSPWHSIFHGPILLAAKVGHPDLPGLRAADSRFSHIASGPLVSLDTLPTLIAEGPNGALQSLRPTDDAPLSFELSDAIQPDGHGPLRLAPFFRLHDARYQIYWQLLDQTTYAEQRERAAAAELAALARENATLARVRPGEQQPEVEHNFRGEDTHSGEWSGRRFRHGRWFSYDLALPEGEPTAELLLTYWGGDTRQFDIFVNDRLLATERLDAPKPGEFINVRHPIPTSILNEAGDGKLTVKFVAHADSLAGGIFDIRLMRRGLTN